MPPPPILDQANGLRASMNWLHTWIGVFFCGLLFVIFWTGTIAVFDREIDRWTMPMTRVAPAEMFSPDAAPEIVARHFPDAEEWALHPPTDRAGAMELYGHNSDHTDFFVFLDPATGEVLGEPGTLGGTDFFYRYHFTLHLHPFNIGLILCALAALVMMALCVSGVIVHKKLFTDFFTFRGFSKPQRVSLDTHNITGVLALPFHFIISFSGIALFGMMYVPAAQTIIFKSNPAEANTGYYSRPASGEPGGDLASIEAMIETARESWNGDNPKRIRLRHVGDANAFIEIQRSPASSLAYRFDSVWFDAATGEVLSATENNAATEVYHTISGLHMVQFRHLLLRWLYFIAGLAGCVLIATGFIFWVESRRKKYAKLKMRGVRFVEGLAVGSVTGVLIASAAFMIANRLLPLGIEGRAGTEVWIFHLVWIGTFLHAFLRPGKAWRDQCWALAAACIIAVLLNGITTGDWIPIAFARGQSGVGAIDVFMLLSAGVCVWTARRLGRQTPRAANTAALTPAGTQ